MRSLFIAACLVLPLASCAGENVRDQSAEVDAIRAELQETVLALQDAQLAGDEQTIEGLQAQVDALTDALESAIAQLPAAWKADLEASKQEGETFIDQLGNGGGAVQTLIGLAGMWWLRDRRKRHGRDPLQDPNVHTPPTTGGGAA